MIIDDAATARPGGFGGGNEEAVHGQSTIYHGADRDVGDWMDWAEDRERVKSKSKEKRTKQKLANTDRNCRKTNRKKPHR
jgi:hypothetical protein